MGLLLFIGTVMKKKKKNMECNTVSCNSTGQAPKVVSWSDYIVWSNNTLSCQTVTASPTKQEEKIPMNTNEQDTLDYLKRRVETVQYALSRKLPDQFNLHVNNNPKTYKGLIDAIKNDKFTLDVKRTAVIDAQVADDEDDDDNDFYFCGFTDGIIWNGPQPDRKGYGAAQVELQTKYQTTKDVVMTDTPINAAVAIAEFEKWVPTGVAN